jgi:phytoene synthase
MMARVMGVTEPETLQRAADLGIALQLTNIARDVLDDAAAGRVYLPLAWLDEAGVPATRVAERRHRRAVASVVARLLAAADGFYAAGDEGIRQLRFRSAWAVAVARGVYSAIGERVLALGEHAWDERVVVPRARKALEAARGLAFALRAASLRQPLASTPRADLWRKGEPSLE